MLDKFLQLGIKVRNVSGNQKTHCPKCSHTRKNKRDKSLSVNVPEGMFNCHHCGYSGNVNITKRDNYTEITKVNINLNERVIGWFKDRGISTTTLEYWKIGESIEYMPQVDGKRRCINFNYFRDNTLVNVKYRTSDKHFKMVTGAELIFYGLNNLNLDTETCYIVEGEIDALSLYESGIYSVVSVPNGASKGNQNLTYLDNCYEYFKRKKEIVLCTDNDEAGIKLRNELARRLGYYRCKYVDFGEFKDANECLLGKGSEYLRSVLKTAKNYPLVGVLSIDDVWQSVLTYSESGIENYSIGLGESDNFFNLAFGEWSVLSGIPNSGKSDIMDQILVNIAKLHKFKSAIFSPESFPYEGHIKRIANKINGKNCTVEDLNNTKDFIKEYFSWIRIDLKNLTLKGILDSFRELVLQRGVKVFVIDPYNMLDHTAQKDFSYIGKQLSLITQFVQQTNSHLFLIAHPKKIESEDGVFKKPNLYSISGSADFFNKAYNGIIVYRCIGNKTEYKSDLVKVYIEKVKRKENGQLGQFDLAPDFYNGGVYKPVGKKDKKFKVIRDNNVPF
ncbi:MAG: putative bifunctional DNA primase/polymerase [Prokaryotic dsDNA virus sp.]|jgi:twinkle protein|nr:MAG: putative bifunctional DNA primase/polymerase [Prokaryotic dsDNA virus sp.]|tara:strand:+ start:630 stop:2309 length:1680 start_codon:yes stop_codon:yes gene_type:complete